MKEPTNKTWIGVAILDPVAGTSKSWSEDVYYKDHPDYSGMPGPTKAPETKAEHAAWWAWYKSRMLVWFYKA